MVQTAVNRPEFLDRISLVTTLQYLVLEFLNSLNESLPFLQKIQKPRYI